MEIKSYKKVSDVPEKYLSSFVEAEIKCWGARPFDEYMVCKNSKCKALYSIEDVHWTKGDINDSFDFKCIECDNDVEACYDREDFLRETIEYFKREASVVLIIENEKVEWLTLLSKTSVEWLIDYEFATRPNSYPKDILLQKISEKIFWMQDASKEELIHWNHMYLNTNLRKNNLSFNLSKAIFSLNPEYKDYPLIGETRFETKIYPIFRRIGFEEIMWDKHWYISMFLPKIQIILDYLNQNNSFTRIRKFYR